MELQGKNVAITGAGSGIGAALARRFAAEGPTGLALIDRDLESANSVATSIDAPEGCAVLAIEADLRSQDGVESALRQAREGTGPIDVCVSNAGIGTGGGVEVPTEAWQNIWDINLMAHVHAARVLVPEMAERGSGWFVHTASAAGLLTQLGSAPYAVTKAAAVSFAEWLAITHGGDGIGVSVLCPQAVNTPMIAGMDAGGVAGVDGIMEADEVADIVVQELRAESFLILPHAQVGEYVVRKAADRDRWIAGMQRLQARFGEAVM